MHILYTERNQEYMRGYYKKNKERISKRQKAHNKKPEVKQRLKEYNKKYYLEHK